MKFLNKLLMSNKKPECNHEVICYNDSLKMIYTACTACYNIKTKEYDIDKMLEYVTKRVRAGHTSILEHGFISMYIENMDPVYLNDLERVRSYGQYLNIFSNQTPEGYYNILIGGSIRAYRDMIFNAFNSNDVETGEDLYNYVLYSHILPILEDYTFRDYFIDFIENSDNLGIPRYIFSDFMSLPIWIQNPEGYKNDTNKLGYTEEFENERVRVGCINSDDYINIFNKCRELGFVETEIDKMICVSVDFKNMSRTATHQLVRHRNAITQESQRYVNYENAGFTVPDADYCNGKTFKIKLFGVEKEMTLAALGKELLSVYPQLIKQGLKKEDARAYLPSNVQCGHVYMTFTVYSMDKFLSLRTDPHAQQEIRSYALAIIDATKHENFKGKVF